MSSVIAYFNLVITHERTINDVPKLYRQEVIDLLRNSGYTELLESDKCQKTVV